MVDVSGYGTLYANKAAVARIEGAERGDGVLRDVLIRAYGADRPGNLDMNLTFDPDGSRVNLTSSAGTVAISGLTAATGDTDATPLSVIRAGPAKLPVRFSSTNNIAAVYSNGTAGEGATLVGAGDLVLDTNIVTEGSRVFLRHQNNSWENGIYLMTSSTGLAFTLTRATDFDTSAKVTAGSHFFVQQGATHGGKGFFLTSSGTLTIGVSNLLFSQFSHEAPSLTTCTDAFIDSPGTGDLLIYNAVNARWENGSLMDGQDKGTLISYSGTGGDLEYVPASTTNNDILSVDTGETSGLKFASPLSVIGTRIGEANGSLVLKAKDTGVLRGLAPSTDGFSVLRSLPADATVGLGYTNIFAMLSSKAGAYGCDISYSSPGSLTPGGAGSVAHTGAVGTLIPIANFFDDTDSQLDQIDTDTESLMAVQGGLSNAGITFNPAGFIAGVTYHFRIGYSVSLLASPIFAPVLCSITLVRDRGTVDELICANSLQIFTFSSTGVSHITALPITVRQTGAAIHTYDLCLQVLDAGSTPSMWLSSYFLTCQLAI